jgi:hypothetical protein
MNAVFEDFSDNTAPPGHVTFSVLDTRRRGHSVSVASSDYPNAVCATRKSLSGFCATTVFKGSLAVIRSKIKCDGGSECEDDGLLYAFIAALLKHPNKRFRKELTSGINTLIKQQGGVHVILVMPPIGPSAWLFAPVATCKSH